MFTFSRSATLLFRKTATTLPHRNKRRCLHQARANALPRSFEQLGLAPYVLSALRDAFPNVQHPTKTQAEVIPAILNGKDAFLKDITGSGK